MNCCQDGTVSSTSWSHAKYVPHKVNSTTIKRPLRNTFNRFVANLLDIVGPLPDFVVLYFYRSNFFKVILASKALSTENKAQQNLRVFQQCLNV